MWKKFIVAGAGFRGFCDAVELAKIPDSEVTIIESAPFFGGLMYSLDIHGFSVDKGVHVFDSIPKSLAIIVDEIMEGKTCEIDFVSASAFNHKVTDGFSLPDLNSLDDENIKIKIKEELLELSKTSVDEDSLESLKDSFNARYGKTAGEIFSRIFKKVYGIESCHVEPNAIAQTSMGRLKFLDDNEMLELKKRGDWLDSVLAARRKKIGKVDDLVSIYPSDGGAMKSWCLKAHKWLEAKGIKVLLKENIEKIESSRSGVSVTTNKNKYEVDKVIWSNDNVKALGSALDLDASYVQSYQHGTPMLFATMVTEASKIKDFTYLQNFDPDGVTYRTASAGLFSHQIKDGISFITSECPAEIGSDIWENVDSSIEHIWNEVKELGIVAPDATLINSNVIRIPSSFKLAKVGYSKKVEEFSEMVKNKNDKVILRNVRPFFRRDIYLDSLSIRDLV